MRARRAARLLAAAMAGATALTACGSGTDDPAAAPSTAAPVNAVTIDGLDYGYTVSGPVKAGITRLTFTNKGEDFHMLALSKLKPGKTTADILSVFKTEDEKDDATVFVDEGDIVGVPSVLTPGATTTTYPSLGAGTYGLICFFPSKTDGEEHYLLGMVNELTVGPELTTAIAPQPVGEVSTTDSTLTVPDFSSGKGIYKYTNLGALSHALMFVKLPEGKTLTDFESWLGNYFQGKAKLEARPGEVWGGLESVQKGQGTYFELALPPGRYLALDTESKGDGDGQEFYRDKNGKLRAEFTVK